MHRCGTFFLGLKLTFDYLLRKVAVEEGLELCRLFFLSILQIQQREALLDISDKGEIIPIKPVTPSPSSSQGGPAVRTPCWPAGSRRSSWGREGRGRPIGNSSFGFVRRGLCCFSSPTVVQVSPENAMWNQPC